MSDSNSPMLYRAASLETAACLWEAVCEMENYCANGEVIGKHVAPSLRATQIRACREAMGSSSLRLTVIGWTEAADAAWVEADVDPVTGHSGQFGDPFDWGFIPDWITANIDWSDPHHPHINPPKVAYVPEALRTMVRGDIYPTINVPVSKMDPSDMLGLPDFPVTIDWVAVASRATGLVSNGWGLQTVAGQLKAEFGGQVPLG